MTHPKAVFFDAGETLLQPNPSWAGLSAKVLRDRGFEVAPDAMETAWRDVGARFRSATDSGVKFSLDHDASHRFWTALYADILAELGVDDPDGPEVLYRTFSDPTNYRLFPDALDCLRELKGRGLLLGIISNFERWLEGLLERLGIRTFFGVVAVSGELGWEKPDPRIFEWAVARAGVPAGACAHVGDQPYFDSDAAQACGLRGVLLDRTGRYDALELDYPRIASLSELPSVVDRS